MGAVRVGLTSVTTGNGVRSVPPYGRMAGLAFRTSSSLSSFMSKFAATFFTGSFCFASSLAIVSGLGKRLV